MSTQPSFDTDTRSIEAHWRGLALAGAAIGLLGILAVAFPLVTGVSIAYALGALLVVGAVVHGVHAVSVHGWRGRLWQAALAVVTFLAGAFVLADPVIGLVSLTLVLIAYLLVDGVAELWLSRRIEAGAGRTSVAASGVLSLVLAGLLWIGFPADAAWAIGLIVGVSLLATGLSMVTVAYGSRHADASAAEAEPRGA